MFLKIVFYTVIVVILWAIAELLFELTLYLPTFQACGNKLLQHGCNSEEAVRTDWLALTWSLYVITMCHCLSMKPFSGPEQSLRIATRVSIQLKPAQTTQTTHTTHAAHERNKCDYYHVTMSLTSLFSSSATKALLISGDGNEGQPARKGLGAYRVYSCWLGFLQVPSHEVCLMMAHHILMLALNNYLLLMSP